MAQLDLFGGVSAGANTAPAGGFEAPPADFVDRIRDELTATLAIVREADALPWPDLTQATLAELRFHSIARWLPEGEAGTLRESFEAELARLYEIIDCRASPRSRQD